MTHFSVWDRISNIPLSKLKKEKTEIIINLIDQAKEDNKNALKAIHWLEGIIKLREIDTYKDDTDD